MSDKQILKEQVIDGIKIQAPEFQNAEKISEYIDKGDYSKVEFEKESYEVYYESQEEEQETARILSDNTALKEYYEKTYPKMLDGLKSKSFFNFPGKKSERKKLRKAHLEKLRKKRLEDEARKTTELAEQYKSKMEGDDVANMTEKDVLKFVKSTAPGNISQYFTIHENYSYEKSFAIMEKVFEMSPLQMMRYELLIRKMTEKKAMERAAKPEFKEVMYYFEITSKAKNLTEKELADVMASSERNYLYMVPKAELNDWVQSKLDSKEYKDLMDGDLQGNDTEELKQRQTTLVQKFNPTLDYKAYRLNRRIMEHEKDFKMPDFVVKSNKYSEGDFKRTCKNFMKPVKYVESDGKLIPATKQDEENLAYNNKWGESLLSDKEADWQFRFDEMIKHIETAFDRYLPDISEYVNALKVIDNMPSVEINEQKILDNLEQLREVNARTLILSGVNHRIEQNNLFHSKYFLTLPKEKQRELNAKADVLTTFSSLIKYVFMKHGVHMDTGGYTKEGATDNIDLLIAGHVNELKGQLSRI